VNSLFIHCRNLFSRRTSDTRRFCNFLLWEPSLFHRSAFSSNLLCILLLCVCSKLPTTFFMVISKMKVSNATSQRSQLQFLLFNKSEKYWKERHDVDDNDVAYVVASSRDIRLFSMSHLLHRVFVTDMRRLTTGIRSEKCVVRRFRSCTNVYLRKPR
jgi:hypothetical protein